MKKIILLLVILSLGWFGFFFLKTENKTQDKEELVVNLNVEKKNEREPLAEKTKEDIQKTEKREVVQKKQFDMSRLALYKDYKKYLNKKDSEVLDDFIFEGFNGKKEIALTFDDGPFPKNTKELIDFLEKEKVPATFFTICKKINSHNSKIYNSKLVSLGFHTYTHRNFDKLSRDEVFKEFDKCQKIYKENGLKTKYFRPAYGVVNRNIKDALDKNNLKGILWSIDSFDWNGLKGEKLVKQVIDNLEKDEIILFHDNRTSLDDLKKIIDEARKNDYVFVSLDELLKK